MFQIILSKTVRPQLNLALEEYLVKNANEDSNIFFLWQNDETVVIGRNQNPWQECDLECIKKDNINLVRRLTGGGAVFHDLGNLNFTFISKKTDTRIEENFDIIINALNKLGINSKFTGKNDLIVGDKKISGNAFVEEGDVICHHGTILIDTDLKRLSDYLKVSDLKLKSKSIKSVVSRVANIKSINNDITIDLLKKVLIDEFKDYFNIDSETLVYTEGIIDELLIDFDNRYEDWNWNYGSSPNFRVKFNDRFDWGEIEINFNVDDAIISEVKVYTDSNDINLASLIEDKMINHIFDKNKIINTLSSIKSKNLSDVCNLFRKDMF